MKLLSHLPNLLTHFHSLLACQNCSCHFTSSNHFSICPPQSPWANMQTCLIFAHQKIDHKKIIVFKKSNSTTAKQKKCPNCQFMHLGYLSNLQTHLIFAYKTNTHLPNIMLSHPNTFLYPLSSPCPTTAVLSTTTKGEKTLWIVFHFTPQTL